MLSFEFYFLNTLLADVGTWFIYRRSLAGSIGPSLDDNDDVPSRKRTKAEEQSQRKIFCPTASCFAHNYVFLTAKFPCFNSTYL